MGTYNVQGTLESGQFIVQNIDSAVEIGTPAFTQMALETTFGPFGNYFIAVAIFFFAFTTILAYYHIAEINVVYLSRFLGRRSQKTGLTIAKIIILIMVGYGALNSAGAIWSWGDVGVGMTAWLNIIGILIMFFMSSRITMRMLADYEAQRKSGQRITFDPAKFGIKNATFWEERLKNK